MELLQTSNGTGGMTHMELIRMYQIDEKTAKKNYQKVGVEIYQRIDDPEIPNLIDTKVIFVSVIVPDGWQVSNVWHAEEEEIF